MGLLLGQLLAVCSSLDRNCCGWGCPFDGDGAQSSAVPAGAELGPLFGSSLPLLQLTQSSPVELWYCAALQGTFSTLQSGCLCQAPGTGSVTHTDTTDWRS